MCTLTWWSTKESSGICFNRDEQRERKPALPPSLRHRNRLAFSYPVDGDHGGTWLFVNGKRVVACLLNYYRESKEAPDASESRGLLMTSLTACESVGELKGRLKEMDLSRYKPFTLFCMAAGDEAMTAHWDGKNLVDYPTSPVRGMMTSSSFESERVEQERLKAFEAMANEREFVLPDELERFHKHHDADRPAESVLMSRHDARTQSFVRLEIKDAHAVLRYEAASANDGEFATPSIVVVNC